MEKLSARAAEITRQEWRNFGLYYISDDGTKEWHLHGSKLGFFQFARILDIYASNAANAGQSKHEHLGPHRYLTLTTWPTARLDERGVWGSPQDMHRLVNQLRDVLAGAATDQILQVKEQYTLSAEYALCLHVDQDSFDRASLDPQLVG
jgi:hypothetical protein